MRRFAALAVLLTVTGCQSDPAAYDAAAKAEAREVARAGAWHGYGQVVAVGLANERSECSEATPFRAGHCLDVLVSTRVPLLDGSGDTTTIDSHVFVWLERRGRRWVVMDKAYWSDEVVVEIQGQAQLVQPPFNP
jgi:hypothetical protein